MNSRLNKMIQAGAIPLSRGVWIDCYSQQTNADIAGTILAGVNSKNHYFVTDMEEPKINVVGELNPDDRMKSGCIRQQNYVIGSDGISMAITAKHLMHQFKVAVLGWTRDAKGEVVDRHPVDVAKTVTAAKRDNTQNYVMQPINAQDGCSRTIKRQYQQTSKANLERQDALGATGATDGYRIRKLTPRECFRLMGVRDEDIDRIQAAGISKSQQYKMAGNSIVVNFLSAIFRQLFIGNFNKHQQTEIFN